MSSVEPRVSGYVGAVHQEIRLSVVGGGPGGTEIVISCDEDGASIGVWNPFRNEWARVNLVGVGKAQA